ncbi:MAG: HAD family hydrolase [Clostridia bacterium]|nr:HAD family hydrolase [Clostridia bacterium]
MGLTTVLFDLDGTLLPMDQDAFVRSYSSLLIAKAAPHGYVPEKMMAALMHGITAMVRNDGSCLNEEAFWRSFARDFGEAALGDKAIFDDFYRNEFEQARVSCGYDERAAQVIRLLKEKGYRLVLATNPFFPKAATYARIRWAGLDASDFELVTTYDNSRFCKPNPAYYHAIMEELGVTPQECMMVGNDVGEDMMTAALGMQVFLLTPCLINAVGADTSAYPQGGYDELLAHIRAMDHAANG